MTGLVSNLKIVSATEENAHDWATIYLEGLKSCKWMSRYLSKQQLTLKKVEQIFLRQIQEQEPKDQFLIGYIDNTPVGIIQFTTYWIPTASKILTHFPLVHPRFQRRGVGKSLVRVGVKNALAKGDINVWSEGWSKDKRELAVYEAFYQAIGFEKKSNRLELCCLLREFDENILPEKKELQVVHSNKMSDELVEVISKAYSNSQDQLHILTNFRDKALTRKFLEKSIEDFGKAGFEINSSIFKFQGEICAGLLTGTSKEKGIILEVGVIQKFRRKRIGLQIVSSSLLSMQAQGIKEVVLGVDANNKAAINLYEKLGFQKSWYGQLLQLENKQKLGIDNTLVDEK
ncbi:MAG: GNAT family N-acetyltransferase [Candidatus Heimdallarchaeota archaeon]|nr:GNAT family N-acetyltransferase [Candidatus Heimdallarchaeota archaeon]